MRSTRCDWLDQPSLAGRPSVPFKAEGGTTVHASPRTVGTKAAADQIQTGEMFDPFGERWPLHRATPGGVGRGSSKAGARHERRRIASRSSNLEAT